MKNTITKGSETLILPGKQRDSNTEIIVNEDYCVVGIILSASSSDNTCTFRKIWDSDNTKTYNAVLHYTARLDPVISSDVVSVGGILEFYRVGEFNSVGITGPELRTESASNFSWIGFVDLISLPINQSDYYVLKWDFVTETYDGTYWKANFYDGLVGSKIYHYNRVVMHRNTDTAKPGYCVPSRNGYSTWKAKYYESYDDATKTYSTKVWEQDCYFESSLWSYDVILPRTGTGVANKKDLVPFGYHPFEEVSDGDKKYLYLEIVEKNVAPYNSTATSDSGTYLYDNSIDLTTLLVPGESVTINTTPSQEKVIDVVYSDHVSFTEALTTSITIGTTFTVHFQSRSTWIYNATDPVRFFWPSIDYFWILQLPRAVTPGDGFNYRYADHGYSGICEESDELIIVSGPVATGPPPAADGGPIPDTDWIFDGVYGNKAMAYCKTASYDYTYQDEFEGGGVKIPLAASSWKVWDLTLSPPAWRDGVASETITSCAVYEIWDLKQRRNGSVFSLTLT